MKKDSAYADDYVGSFERAVGDWAVKLDWTCSGYSEEVDYENGWYMTDYGGEQDWTSCEKPGWDTDANLAVFYRREKVADFGTDDLRVYLEGNDVELSCDPDDWDYDEPYEGDVYEGYGYDVVGEGMEVAAEDLTDILERAVEGGETPQDVADQLCEALWVGFVPDMSRFAKKVRSFGKKAESSGVSDILMEIWDGIDAMVQDWRGGYLTETELSDLLFGYANDMENLGQEIETR